jgi:hypothetical protein
MRGRDAKCGRAHSATAEAPPHTEPEGTRPDDEISGDLPHVAGDYRPIRHSAPAPPLSHHPTTTHPWTLQKNPRLVYQTIKTNVP